MANSIDIGIIGGTGVYDPELFSSKQEIKVHTPYGETSDFVILGEYSGVKASIYTASRKRTQDTSSQYKQQGKHLGSKASLESSALLLHLLLEA